jgi:hypothetical protein
MGFKKKTGVKKTRKSTSKGPIFKQPHFIGGITLLVLGLCLLIVALAPNSVGSAGIWLYDRVLFALFGKAAVLAGLYCLAMGAGLLLVKRKILCLTGITCLWLPLLVLVNAMFTSTPDDPQAPVIHGAYLGHLLGSGIAQLIGTAGLTLVSLIVFM